MNKSTKKYNKFNAGVVNALVKKHGLSSQYIRQCLRGERNSITSDTIRKQYNTMKKEVESILNK